MFLPIKEAKKLGHIKYKSNVTCKKNHEPIRYVGNSGCVQCNLGRPVHKKHKQYVKTYKNRNKKRIQEYNAEYYRRPHVRAMRAMRQKSREQRKRNAEVKFNEEFHNLFMQEAYLLSQLRSQTTKTMHHVDHIVPLKGKNVCGLHSWTNIRVVPSYENLSKGNKLLEELL